MTYQRQECDCRTCQSACTYKPGWFMPEQIAALATALGISVQDLFRDHLQVDWWDNYGDDGETVFILSPRLANLEGGSMFPGDPRGTCHWFKDGKCAIHTQGKPAECQQSHHTITGDEVDTNHSAIAAAWAPREHQQFIRDLLGREPKAGHFYGDSLFSRFWSGDYDT